jgi:hypothetical protein
MNLKVCVTKWSWPNLRWYFGIFLELIRKTTKIQSVQLVQEYKFEAPICEIRCSSATLLTQTFGGLAYSARNGKNKFIMGR